MYVIYILRGLIQSAPGRSSPRTVTNKTSNVNIIFSGNMFLFIFCSEQSFGFFSNFARRYKKNSLAVSYVKCRRVVLFNLLTDEVTKNSCRLRHILFKNEREKLCQ